MNLLGGIPWEQDAVGKEDRAGQSAAVDILCGGASPHVRHPVEAGGRAYQVRAESFRVAFLCPQPFVGPGSEVEQLILPDEALLPRWGLHCKESLLGKRLPIGFQHFEEDVPKDEIGDEG